MGTDSGRKTGKTSVKHTEEKGDIWSWEGGLVGKRSLCKHENLKSGRSHPCSEPDLVACACNSSAWERRQRQEDPWLLLARQSNW